MAHGLAGPSELWSARRVVRILVWGNAGSLHWYRLETSEQQPFQTKTRGFLLTGYLGLAFSFLGLLFSGFFLFLGVSFRSRYPLWYPELYGAPMKQNLRS
jgi:hypothetical protein